MKLLLLGRNGQLGRSIEPLLMSLGELVSLDRHGCDLASADSVREAFRAAAPDVVINAGAYTAVDKAETERDLAYAVNAQAPSVLAEECKKRGSLLVHYSTDYVYAGDKATPYVETDPVAPLGVYGMSKLEGERAIEAAGARALVLRTAWVFGPIGNNFVKTMLRLARERDSLRVVHDQVGNPTSSELLANATALALAEHGSDMPLGVYHLAGSESCSWNDFARDILASARLRPSLGITLDPERVERITTADYPTPAKRPANSRLDTTRFRRDFGQNIPGYAPYLERMLDLRIG